MPEPIVIIGAGQAASQAISSVRADGFDGPIQLFGDEPWLPYQRPPLSKAFLAGETAAEDLELKPAAFYRDRQIDLQLDRAVTRIDIAAMTIECRDGRVHPYRALLLTTGARPRPLQIPGNSLPGVHLLRTINDVDRLRGEMVPGARIVIIGGGYVGLEVAAKARKLGLDVDVIETQDHLLAGKVARATSAFLTDLHLARGVRLHMAQRISHISGKDRADGVVSTEGRIFPADIVLIAIGADPNQELAEKSGIATADGILVDKAARTSAHNIFAAGDVANFPSKRYGRRIRLESVQNAIDQAKAAASAMLGNDTDYDPLPWFWSDQYETKLQIVGLSHGYQSVVSEDCAPGKLTTKYFKDDTLVAVDSINDARSHMMGRRLLAGDLSMAAA